MLIIASGMPLCATVVPPVRIMPLGDSITEAGWGLPIQGSYRTSLYELSTAAGFNVDFIGTFSDTGNSGPPDGHHQGEGGARIDLIQANIGTWLNSVEDPDVILLLDGTNDFWQNYQIATIQARLSGLIADIATRRPYAKTIVSNLPLRTDSALIEAQQSEFNATIPGIVAEQVALGRQVSWVDMHSALTPLDLMIDGVHPSTSGYSKIADALVPAIAAVISPQGTSNPPEIARIGPMVDLSHVSVVFSKPVADDAVNLAHYTLSGGLTVIGAELDAATKRTITLTTCPQNPGTGYNLEVSGVRDRTEPQILIAPGAMVSFSPSAISNGSFEYDYAGWTPVGNQQITSAAPYIPSDGAKMAAFNAGQLAPGATLAQTFSTTAGQTYRLVFDFGVISYNTSGQRLQLAIRGAANLAGGTDELTGVGGGAIVWKTVTYHFTADSPTTTVTFSDVSTTSQNIDMLLDNVRVVAPDTRTLSVRSEPVSDVSMAISPSDIGGAGNGATELMRWFAVGTLVTVTAPLSHGGRSFLKWRRNGIDWAGAGPSLTIAMNANLGLNAVYGVNDAPVAVGDAYATTPGVPLVVTPSGVLGNDSDLEGATLTALLNVPPSNGSLSLYQSGGFVYSPNAGFRGQDHFSYRASDGFLDSEVATVSIMVSGGAKVRHRQFRPCWSTAVSRSAT